MELHLLLAKGWRRAPVVISFIALTQVAYAPPVTNGGPLGFGTIVATGSAGTVTVSPTGVRTAAGGVVLASGAGVAAASFIASGPNWRAYSIVLPGSATLTTGTKTMTVNTFKSNPTGGGVLNGSGSATVTIGATLHIGVAQSTGSYAGTFPVTLSF